MHTGRRTGNRLGRELPESIPGNDPRSPFLDMRIVDKPANVVRIFYQPERVELLGNLYANGAYRQTKNTQFMPPFVIVDFDLLDTGGGKIVTVSMYLRDNPSSIFASTTLVLTGAGITETSAVGSSQTITPIIGSWFRVRMRIASRMNDQYKMNFLITGGNARVGAVSLTAEEVGAIRRDITSDMTQWTPALAINGLTGSGATAYDLINNLPTYDDMFRWVSYFDEQLSTTERHVFDVVHSGPNLSIEGPELPTRGILGQCTTNRVHLQWQSNVIPGISEIIIEASQDGSPFVTIATVAAERTGYFTPPLVKGVWRFRLRGQDIAGNISGIASFADFSPHVWFDTTDPSTVFTDLPGTIQVVNDQDAVALITNKGSLGVQLDQVLAPSRPLFVSDAMSHGAGIHISGPSIHMSGGAAPAWLGVGQAFDLYTSVLLELIPATTPSDSAATTTYHKIFSFEGFFELIVADFNDTFFTTLDGDYNTGYAIIARMYTGAGLKSLILPFSLHAITIIRASYNGSVLGLKVNENLVTVSATGPIAPTVVRVFGQAAAGFSLNGYIGPIVMFTSTQIPATAALILDQLGAESNASTAFIIEETIQAPTGMQISFSGLMGTVSCNASPTASVIQYNLYHNSGTEEFPDFSVPAATNVAPGFTFAMIPGLWRIVMRASDGANEDGNFENRLDVVVVEDSPGILELEGARPNPLTQVSAKLLPGGNVKFSAFYRTMGEAAVGASAYIWIFEQGTPIDTSGIPTVQMPIPSHSIGIDATFELTSTTIGPFSEITQTAIIRTISADGDYQTGRSELTFTPDATPPAQPIGLRGNKC